MAKGYWIAQANVSDPAGHGRYVEAARPAFVEYGGTFLVRGGETETLEGNARPRQVVCEFPSAEAAIACYRSDIYQAGKAHRDAAGSIVDVVVVEGNPAAAPARVPTGDGVPGPGFWIVRINVTDPELYKEYIAADTPVAEAWGANFLVRGGQQVILENPSRARHVVIGFESMEKARGCYHSAGYQAAAAIRQRSADADLVVVAGLG